MPPPSRPATLPLFGRMRAPPAKPAPVAATGGPRAPGEAPREAPREALARVHPNPPSAPPPSSPAAPASAARAGLLRPGAPAGLTPVAAAPAANAPRLPPAMAPSPALSPALAAPVQTEPAGSSVPRAGPPGFLFAASPPPREAEHPAPPVLAWPSAAPPPRAEAPRLSGPAMARAGSPAPMRPPPQAAAPPPAERTSTPPGPIAAAPVPRADAPPRVGESARPPVPDAAAPVPRADAPPRVGESARPSVPDAAAPVPPAEAPAPEGESARPPVPDAAPSSPPSATSSPDGEPARPAPPVAARLSVFRRAAAATAPREAHPPSAPHLGADPAWAAAPRLDAAAPPERASHLLRRLWRQASARLRHLPARAGSLREAWRRHGLGGPDWAGNALRGVTYGGAILLAGSLLLASLPPILADTSTRAVVNAPVVLVTAPIDGELDRLLAEPGDPVGGGEVLARMRNERLDRSTLIGLENQTQGTRISLNGLRERIGVLTGWLETLDQSIREQREVALNVAQEVEREARAKAASAAATLAEQSTLVARQRRLLEAGVVSREVLLIALHRERAAQEDLLAAQASLGRREAERRSIEMGSYAGESQSALGALIERRRDAALELSRLRVDEAQLTSNLNALSAQTASETARLARLLDAEVPAPSNSHVLRAFASPGQRLSAGDTIAGMVECRNAFVVGIFSVRQAHRLAVGAPVVVEAEGWSEPRYGRVRQVLPRTTDRVDTNYAVPFPPMERREMYVLIDLEPAPPARALRGGRPAVPCDIGRWVSVEIEGGVFAGLASAALRFSRNALAMIFGQARADAGD